MSATPQLWMLTGGNGAGKTTFYTRFLEPRGISFVNADRIARTLAPENPEALSYDAARLGARLRDELVEARLSFCFETVFSHVSKIDFMARAKAAGYVVVLVYIHLELPQLHQARVAQRVAEGGHDVPEEKVLTRLPRTQRNVRAAMPLADEVHLIDNSSAEAPFLRVASVVHGEARFWVEAPPLWARRLVES